MTSIPFADPHQSLDSVGRLNHEYLIPQNVKKMKEASSVLYDFNNRLELEQRVRPVMAAQLQIELDSVKMPLSQQVLMGKDISINNSYFRRTRAGNFQSTGEKLVA